MFTLENTTGYTQKECDDLNAEFAAIVVKQGLEEGTDEYNAVESAFNDEVARR